VPVRRLVEAYGDAPEQVGEWWLPGDGSRPAALVVLVHGGFWKPQYDRHLEDDVAALLAERGFAVWNVDYRPAPDGWPSTLADAAAAADFAADRADDLDLHLGRVAVAGHSAGGHLALWLGSRAALPAGAVGSAPRLRPTLVVAQAPVADLALAHRADLGDGAVARFVGGSPAEVPERYALASPVELVQADGCRVVLVHGDADPDVPLAQSEAYEAAARAVGRAVELRVLAGTGHMEHVDPASEAVGVLLDALGRL
jgi:acetyl esterase/lipase